MKQAHSFVFIEPHPSGDGYCISVKVGPEKFRLEERFDDVAMAGRLGEQVSKAIAMIQEDAKAKGENYEPIPSMELIIRLGVDMGLPEMECRKFFTFYDSKGWVVGKTRMKSVNSALAGWKCRWQERRDTPSASVETVIRHEELKRVEKELEVLQSDSQYTPLDQAEKNRRKELASRRKELLGRLGMTA